MITIKVGLPKRTADGVALRLGSNSIGVKEIGDLTPTTSVQDNAKSNGETEESQPYGP